MSQYEQLERKISRLLILYPINFFVNTKDECEDTKDEKN
jgi:hypothetical protein